MSGGVEKEHACLRLFVGNLSRIFGGRMIALERLKAIETCLTTDVNHEASDRLKQARVKRPDFSDESAHTSRPSGHPDCVGTPRPWQHSA